MAPVEWRKPDLAVKLARRALRRDSSQATYLNTLAVALYRLKDWEASLDAMRRSLPASNEWAAYDLYFLAMASHQLREERAATDYYHQAVYWHETHEPALSRTSRRELAEIRREAEATLEVAGTHRAGAPNRPQESP